VKAPGPVEHRESVVGDVSFPQRIIEVVVVPYDEAAIVEYRGEMWQESFERGAWDGIETRPDQEQVKANRDHDRTRLVGKVVRYEPSRQEGLVADVKIAKTALGDETLALADEGMIGVSAGFAARMRDQVFNRRAKPLPSRRVKKAFLDHIAFLGDHAYKGAGVLNVRSDGQEAAELPKLVTPVLDELIAWQQAQLRRRGGRVA
jgi:hypothetical protein